MSAARMEPKKTAKQDTAGTAGLESTAGVSRRERKRAATRRRIIEAAVACFVELGFAQTVVAQITNRADLGYGTFYQYFNSKDELLSSLVSEMVSTLDDFAIPPASERNSILSRTRYEVRGILRWYKTHRTVLLALREATALDHAFQADWERIHRMLTERVSQDIGWAKRKGLFKDLDVDIASVGVVGLFEGIGHRYILRESDDVDLEHLADEVAKFCCNAMFLEA